MGRIPASAQAESPNPGQQAGSSYPQNPGQQEGSSYPQNPGQQEGSSYPQNPGQQAGSSHPQNPGQQAGSSHPQNPGQQAGRSHPQNFQTGQAQYVGRSWNSGLFDCHDDPTNAVMTAIFPCVTFGQIAEVLDAVEPFQGSQLTCPFGSLIYMLMMPICAGCFIGSQYRAKLRKRYDLVEAPYTDVISHLFCPFCSLCQEFRELKNHQLDPALGWKGILAQQQGKQASTPPPPQSMSK